MWQTFCLLDLLTLRQSKINFVFGFIVSFNCRLRLEYFLLSHSLKKKIPRQDFLCTLSSPSHVKYLERKENFVMMSSIVGENKSKRKNDLGYCITIFSINLLAFYHKCRALIGYATHYRFNK